ncbi:MAG: sulfite exporter TauE/SafE family protein [Bacteroidales bacterium]|nr:sulfite exporter TauE/SafE family protein [Bacteroidales bacterium]
MNNEIGILIVTAASLGFVHTILGPDHYLPFIVMSKARNWSVFRTISITFLCGLGHVASSVILGTIGIIFGVALHKLEFFESTRGDWAAWGFLIFGVGYLVWALWRLYSNKAHKHTHTHGSIVHSHEHDHKHGVLDATKVPHKHSHGHETTNLTPWLLFLVFVLGPCEPLIPILMYPAAQASTMGVVAVTSVFAITTIVTMLTVVIAVSYGFKFVKTATLEKYTHVIAGSTVALSGVLILVGL